MMRTHIYILLSKFMDSEVDNGTFRDWLGEESEKGEGVVKE